jgi:hypothetical protein
MTVTEEPHSAPVPGASRFDQRHLIRLHQVGLLTELPYELGPMPSFDFGPGIDYDLERWNLVRRDPGTEHGFSFTEEAAEVFAGVDHWDWAVWGLALLYDERPRITVDLPDEMMQYGLQYALRDIPRVTFMITVREDIVTVILHNSSRISIDALPAHPDPAKQIGTILRELLDPKGQWQPYPLTGEVVVPLETVTQAAVRRIDPDGPGRLDLEDMRENYAYASEFTTAVENAKTEASAEAAEQSEKVRDILTGSGLSQRPARALAELLKVHNVANVQVCATWRGPTGKVALTEAAAGVSFFDGGDDEHRGVVVSWPMTHYGDDLWVTYAPGTEDAYIRAIRSLAGVAKSLAGVRN